MDNPLSKVRWVLPSSHRNKYIVRVVVKLKAKSDEVDTRYAKLPLVIVALNNQTTLGVYDTWNRPPAYNVKYLGMVGELP